MMDPGWLCCVPPVVWLWMFDPHRADVRTPPFNPLVLRRRPRGRDVRVLTAALLLLGRRMPSLHPCPYAVLAHRPRGLCEQQPRLCVDLPHKIPIFWASTMTDPHTHTHIHHTLSPILSASYYLSHTVSHSVSQLRPAHLTAQDPARISTIALDRNDARVTHSFNIANACAFLPTLFPAHPPRAGVGVPRSSNWRCR